MAAGESKKEIVWAAEISFNILIIANNYNISLEIHIFSILNEILLENFLKNFQRKK